MDTYTLQINTSGAWRTLCEIDLDASRLVRLCEAIGTIMELAPGVGFCLWDVDGVRHWFDLDADTGRAALRSRLI